MFGTQDDVKNEGKMNADLELLESAKSEGKEDASKMAQEAIGESDNVLQAQNVYENSPLASTSAKIAEIV